jgi:hypothetical protein
MQLRRLTMGVGTAALGLALLGACDAEPAQHAATAAAAAVANARLVTLYKNPSCACCAEWGDHLRENGFQVEIKKAGWDLMKIKSEHGVAPELASCHTALVGDYVLEGHVPADVIKKLLAERPQIRGLAVPGMPDGVPGMPDAGPNREPYEILAIQPDGGTELYATR